MAFRLDDLVVCGELLNTSHYSTHGWIRLRGQEQALVLQLTGNCRPDLVGRHIRFEARDADEREAFGDAGDVDLSSLAWQQVGPTGDMTTERRLQAGDCAPEIVDERTPPGEAPPSEAKRRLYLEWYSQNGRMVVELVDPVIEFVEDDGEDDAATDAAADAAIAGEADGSPAFESLPPDASQFFEPDSEQDDDVADDDDDGLQLTDEELDGESDDDPYGLFPDDLQQQFDLQASQLDSSLEEDESKPQTIRELELMDELIESGEGDIIAGIFDDPVKLPRPEQLDDEQAEAALKLLLAQLAQYGIALSICEHFTPRDAYRLLLEDICTGERAYPQLRATQWVQHFMTSEFCEKCEAELDREFEEYERRRKEEGDEEDAGEDEIPY